MKFSHFASLESGEVLKAATEDLIRIFELEVSNPKLFGGGGKGRGEGGRGRLYAFVAEGSLKRIQLAARWLVANIGPFLPSQSNLVLRSLW